MRGWFVTSGYFRNDAVQHTEDAFSKACAARGVELVALRSDEITFVVDGKVTLAAPKLEKPDFVLFWDKDVTLASLIEKWGVRVFNSARAIELCDDKVKTLSFLAELGIDMPKTVFAPLLFANRTDESGRFLKNLTKALDFPIVVKDAQSSFGSGVFLAEDQEQLEALHAKLAHRPHLYQQFVKSSAGHDARVIVIGGKAVARMVRQNDVDFRANVELGGRPCNEKIPAEYVALAEKCARALKLDYAGVDLLFGDKPLLCEVNSNAYFGGIESCVKVNVAEIYTQYILEELNYAKR